MRPQEPTPRTPLRRVYLGSSQRGSPHRASPGTKGRGFLAANASCRSWLPAKCSLAAPALARVKAIG